MARNDKNYPDYERIKVDPSKPPKNYWNMGARQCTSCSKMWPQDENFRLSPCCDARTIIEPDAGPAMRWETAAKELLNKRFERFYDEWNEGLSDEALALLEPLPVDEDEVAEELTRLESHLGRELERERN